MTAMFGFHRLKDLPVEKLGEHAQRQLLAGQKGMIVWSSVKAGLDAPAHQHPHEQIIWVLSGRMNCRIDKETRSCGPGDVCVIPGGVEHQTSFPEDAEVVEFFAPPREDILAGSAYTAMPSGSVR